MPTIYITSGTTFSPPGDWTGLADTVECIGGGGGGKRSNSSFVGLGGGGGGYAYLEQVVLVGGEQLQIGAGGAPDSDGGDTWIGGSSLASSLCGAEGGKTGSGSTGGAGGRGMSGSVLAVGGSGGGAGSNQFDGGGGGGAAGPNGPGGAGGAGGGPSAGAGGGGNGGGGAGGVAVGGVAGQGGTAWDGTAGGYADAVTTPQDGSHGSGGSGGSAPRGTAGAGGNGNDWDSTHGSGGGGGGSDVDNNGCSGGAGGLYGGGGGGESWPPGFGTVPGTAGAGAQGIIRITYTAAGVKERSASNTLSLQQAVAGALNGSIFLFAENTLSMLSVLLSGPRLTSLYGTQFSLYESETYGLGTDTLTVATSILNLSHAARTETTLNRSASNTITFTGTAVGNAYRQRSASNTLTFTDHASNFNGDITVPQTLTINSTATAEAIRRPTNTFTINQSVNALAIHLRSASNTLTFSETAYGFSGRKSVAHTFTMTSVATVNTVLNREISQSLTYVQVAEAEQIRPASNTITFSETATATASKGVLSTFTMTQTPEYNYTPHFDTDSNLFLIAQSAVGSMVRNRTVNQTFTINQTAIAQRVKSLVTSNLFVMASNAAAAKIFLAHNTIVFAGSATVQKVISASASNTLVINQTLARNVRLGLSSSNALTFLHTYMKPTTINGFFEIIPIPEVMLTKVVNRVSFRTKDRAIILKPPLLGDGEATPGKIVLQRTLNGGTFVYARRARTRTLKYTFEMDSFKTLEMRRFMLDCLSEPIWLENWKGELWIGYFMNNPFETTTRSRAAPRGEWHSFQVEFEGERIH